MAAEPVQPSRSVEEVWEELSELAGPFRDGSLHLKDLLKDPARARSLVTELDGLLLDYSRQRVSAEVMASLFRRLSREGEGLGIWRTGEDHPPASISLRLSVFLSNPCCMHTGLAEATGVRSKMRSMVDGGRINRTEQRAVLHIALRAPEDVSRESLSPLFFLSRAKFRSINTFLVCREAVLPMAQFHFHRFMLPTLASRLPILWMGPMSCRKSMVSCGGSKLSPREFGAVHGRGSAENRSKALWRSESVRPSSIWTQAQHSACASQDNPLNLSFSSPNNSLVQVEAISAHSS